MQRAADWWLDAHEDEESAAERLWSDAAVTALLETLNQARPRDPTSCFPLNFREMQIPCKVLRFCHASCRAQCNCRQGYAEAVEMEGNQG